MAKSEDLTLNVKVKGADDIDDLSDDIDDLFKKVDKLTAHPAELLLTAKFGDIEREIADLVLKLDKLDSTDPEVEVTIARLNQLQGDLDAVIGKLRQVDATKVEPTVTLDTSGVEQGLGQVRRGTEDLSDAARGSRNALANMIGNSAQDISGLNSSLGVAIGQLAEFGSDAALAGEGLASVGASIGTAILPIAALAAGTVVLQQAMKAFSGNQKEVEENTREMTAALEDSLGTLDDWKAAIEDAFSGGTADNIDAFGVQIENMLEKALDEEKFEDFRLTLTNLGLTFDDLANLASTAGTDMTAYAESQLTAAGATDEVAAAVAPLVAVWGDAQQVLQRLQQQQDQGFDVQAQIDWVEANRDAVDSINEVGSAFDNLNLDDAISKFLQLQKSVDPATRSLARQAINLHTARDGTVDYVAALAEYVRLQQEAARHTEAATQAATDYAAAIESGAAGREEFNKQLRQQADESDIVQGVNAARNAADVNSQLWQKLIADMKDGSLSTETAVEAYNRLADSLGLNNDEMDQLVAQKVDEQLQADAEAADQAAQALRDLSNAVTAAGVAVNTTDFRADAIGRVFDQLNEFSDLDTAEQLTGITEAWDAIDQAAKDFPDTIVGIDLVPDSWEDVKNMPDDLKGVTDAIGQFRDAVQTQMAEAFEFGGPGGLRAAAEDIRAQFETPFREMMARNGASVEETNAAWNQFLHDVGLAPDQVEIEVTLAIDQQKLQILQDIASGAGLEGERKLSFDIAIANQDPETALRILNEQLASLGKEVTFTVNPETGEVEVALDALEQPRSTKVTAVPETAAANKAFTNTAKERTAPIVAEAHTDKAAGALDTTASDKTKGKSGRTATITAVPVTSAAETALNHVARARSTLMSVLMHGALQAEQALNTIARDRTADIFVQTHGAGAATSSVNAIPGVAAAPTGLAAPAATATSTPSAVTMIAPTPHTQIANVTINAGVIGNRFEVQRAVTRSLRQSQRLNGSRN